MNVFQKVTLQGVKKNKSRTVVTIIGIILSVAMITAVATIISSFQNFFVETEKEVNGDWHAQFENVTAEFVEQLSNDGRALNLAIKQNVGYAQLADAPYSNKKYINISGFSDELYETFKIRMIEGRLPENDGEIVVANHIDVANPANYEIGQSLNLELGDRLFNGEALTPDEPFISEESGEEEFVSKGLTKEYKIVGICERVSYENYSGAAYEFITKAEKKDAFDSTNNIIYAKMNKPREVYDFAEENIAKYEKEHGATFVYDYNSDLLMLMGVSSVDTVNAMLYGLGAILIIIIMIGSILLIYNAFSISVSERVKQFGIMSSVGATKKQLRKSVIFEGFIVGIIGIPLGVLAGISGIAITLRFLSSLFESMTMTDASMSLHISWIEIVIAVVVGVFTIYISAYIPARKASKQSAIESIKQSNYVKINPKKLKTSKLVSKLFGLEGTIALKNLKRNKKRYRSTVISLFVSIVLFITASSFGMFLNESVSIALENNNFDLAYNYEKITSEDAKDLYGKLSKATGVKQRAWSTLFYFNGSVGTELFSSEYLSYIKDPVDDSNDENLEVPIFIFSIDDDSYRKYLKDLGISESEFYDEGSKNVIAMSNIEDFDYEESRFLRLKIFKNELPKEISIENTEDKINITKFTSELPYGVLETLGTAVRLFIPKSREAVFTEMLPKVEWTEDNDDAMSINMTQTLTFSTDEPYRTADEMEIILNGENLPLDYLHNVAEQEDMTRNFIDIMEIFSYGFIILISLITIANVFNTVSTNISLRRREFAILKSVGMTDKGTNRMMNFECIFYGMKALLYGLPVSVGVSYLIYRAVISGVGIPFRLPWMSIGISVFSVFLVVFITMLYSIRKIKKENIISALVSDN